MSFNFAWILCFLLIPLVLCVLELRGRGLAVALPFDHTSQPEHPVLNYLLKLCSLLPHLLLALAIILAAEPRRIVNRSVEQEVTNILFLLDESGSMTEAMGKKPKYTVAMESIEKFISYRKGDSFGLMVFGGDAFPWIPVTRDMSAIRCASQFLSPSVMPSNMQGTNFIPALDLARETLKKQKEGDRLVIMMTDGFSADIYGEPGRQLAARLQAERIKVYAVLALNGQTEPNFERLVKSTGGEMYFANDPKTVEEVMKKIDAMNPTRLKPSGLIMEDFFKPLALCGVAVLLLYVLSLMKLRYTPW